MQFYLKACLRQSLEGVGEKGIERYEKVSGFLISFISL